MPHNEIERTSTVYCPESYYDANGNVVKLADLLADPNDPAGAIAAA